jgi:hypothetical protein
MIKLHTQQGDCVLEIVTEIPRQAKKIELTKSFIVLKGEGVNAHTIEDCSGVEVYEVEGVLYLKTKKLVELTHQEHGKTKLEPNKIYRRVIEREFDYEGMEARNTRD